jgi:hypothetical protein
MAWGQVYYPKIEWLIQGTMADIKIGELNDPPFIFKGVPNFPYGDSIFLGISSYNHQGELLDFNENNTLIIHDKELFDVSILEVLQTDQDSNKNIELFLSPSYILDSTRNIIKPIFLRFNKLVKSIDTTAIKWDFNFYRIYDAIKVDSFYFFIVHDNIYDENLKNEWIVKTDKHFNILHKYAYSTLYREKLYFWNNTLILYGGGYEFDPSVGRDVYQPTLYLHDANNLKVFAKRAYKTKNSNFNTHLVSLQALADTALLAFVGGDWNSNVVFTLNKNFNAIDSVSLVQQSGMSRQIFRDSIFYGFTDDIYKGILHIFEYDPIKNHTQYKTYDIGINWLSGPMSLIKKDSLFYVYGSTSLRNTKNEFIGWRSFRFIINKNGVPLESRKPPSGLEEDTFKPTLDIVPNPNKGSFNLSLNERFSGNTYQLKVYDALGNLHFTESFSQHNPSFNLALKPGMYVVSVSSENGQTFQKMVVEY